MANCLLDPSVRVRGANTWPAPHPIVVAVQGREAGVLELPCPEHLFAGADRPPRSREGYETPDFFEHCRRLAAEVRRLLEDLAAPIDDCVLIVGVEGSPACGVFSTHRGRDGVSKRSPGEGIFIEVLREELAGRAVTFTSVDTRMNDNGVQRVLDALDAEVIDVGYEETD